MDGLEVGDVRTQARGAWLFERVVTTGSLVPGAVGGSEAGPAPAHRGLSSQHTSVRGILGTFGTRKREGLRLDATQVRVPGKLFRLAAPALGAAVRILQRVSARAGGRRPMQVASRPAAAR